MPRLMLSDELWSKLEKILLQHAIYHKPDLRLTVEGMLYRMRVGCPWRDLPSAFGIWNTIYKRFNAWSAAGKWLRIFKTLIADPDFEWVFTKAHQHSAGAHGGGPEAIGTSRAGRTSKIHLAVDAHGLPVEFEITGGQVHDCTAAPALIELVPAAEVVVADKGYDSERIREQIEAQGARPVIPRKRTSIKGNADLDRGLYRCRHLVENAFSRLKQYRAVAFRHDKLKRNYESTVAMACAFLGCLCETSTAPRRQGNTMSDAAKIVEANDDEINIWELMEYLKSGWQWLAGGCAVGLLGATGFLMLAPAKYEATAVVQPATIGMIDATTTVEPVAQTIERLKLVTFYGDDIVKVCQAGSAKDLAEGVKVSIVKGSNLVSLTYRADSVAQAEACMTKIVGQLSQSQIDIATPLIKELEDQRASTKQQIDDAERFLAQHEKGLSSAPTGSVLLMLKREELMKLQKLYREQRIQLTEPLTQPMKLLEPIYAPERAVFPKKLLTVTGGFIGGLFLGLLALFINRGWRRYKSR